MSKIVEYRKTGYSSGSPFQFRKNGDVWEYEYNGVWRRDPYQDGCEDAAKGGRLTPVKPLVRYFVPLPHINVHWDHLRVSNGRMVQVATDGSESREFSYPEKFGDSAVADGSYKEVFPESSESLIRSHRYAAKYDEGKKKGHDEGYKLGYDQAKKDQAEDRAKSYKDGYAAAFSAMDFKFGLLGEGCGTDCRSGTGSTQ
jgi:hypothetical protein